MAPQDSRASILCPHPSPRCCLPHRHPSSHCLPSDVFWDLYWMCGMLVEYIRDGASNFSRRQMGSYLSSSMRNSSWMFHSSGLSIHGLGLGKNRAQSTLWVISGRLGVGLGHPRDRVELGCASAISRWVPETSSLWQKGLEIIRARLGARGRQN